MNHLYITLISYIYEIWEAIPRVLHRQIFVPLKTKFYYCSFCADACACSCLCTSVCCLPDINFVTTLFPTRGRLLDQRPRIVWGTNSGQTQPYLDRFFPILDTIYFCNLQVYKQTHSMFFWQSLYSIAVHAIWRSCYLLQRIHRHRLVLLPRKFLCTILQSVRVRGRVDEVFLDGARLTHVDKHGNAVCETEVWEEPFRAMEFWCQRFKKK